MNERSKLEEARFFYREMEKAHDDREAFPYNLSAFLSAARSVLQYAEREVDGTPSQAWYDNTMASSDVLGFFKGKRDLNIHEEPVQPKQDIHITVSRQLSEGVSLTVRDEEGNIVDEYEDPPDEPGPDEPRSETNVDRRWIFDDWPGNEDTPTLCRQYLDELETFIDEGGKDGHITG